MLTPVVTRCVFRSQFDQKNCDVGPRWRAYSDPRSPSWTKDKVKEGRGERRREKRRKRKKEKGEEREGDAVSQFQFLDQPVVTVGLSRTVSEKELQFQSKNCIFLHS